jgi:hypothetical protein
MFIFTLILNLDHEPVVGVRILKLVNIKYRNKLEVLKWFCLYCFSIRSSLLAIQDRQLLVFIRYSWLFINVVQDYPGFKLYIHELSFQHLHWIFYWTN